MGTLVGLFKPENLSQLAFELFSQIRLSQNTIEISYQSYNGFCSLIQLWLLQYHQYLLLLFCLCGWDCLSQSTAKYSCFHLFHAFSLRRTSLYTIFSSFTVNCRLQWNLLYSHLFWESCCLVLIRLTGCLLQCKSRDDCSNWSQL